MQNHPILTNGDSRLDKVRTGLVIWGTTLYTQAASIGDDPESDDYEPWACIDPVLHEVAHVATLPRLHGPTTESVGNLLSDMPNEISDRFELAAWVVQRRTLLRLGFELSVERAVFYASQALSRPRPRASMSVLEHTFRVWDEEPWPEYRADAIVSTCFQATGDWPLDRLKRMSRRSRVSQAHDMSERLRERISDFPVVRRDVPHSVWMGGKGLA